MVAARSVASAATAARAGAGLVIALKHCRCCVVVVVDVVVDACLATATIRGLCFDAQRNDWDLAPARTHTAVVPQVFAHDLFASYFGAFQAANTRALRPPCPRYAGCQRQPRALQPCAQHVREARRRGNFQETSDAHADGPGLSLGGFVQPGHTSVRKGGESVVGRSRRSVASGWPSAGGFFCFFSSCTFVAVLLCRVCCVFQPSFSPPRVATLTASTKESLTMTTIAPTTHSLQGRWEDALAILRAMVSGGISPNVYTVCSALRACCIGHSPKRCVSRALAKTVPYLTGPEDEVEKSEAWFRLRGTVNCLLAQI